MIILPPSAMDNEMSPHSLYQNQHHMNPGPPPPLIAQTSINTGQNVALGQNTVSNQQPLITSSINRSQRCGVCKGCQCKPCGQCTYCQDSPQFGGPGVKKQSCVERRCLRVLENRLQREVATFKARLGCNQCEDCRLPDCHGCLVCLDKKFFDNRYLTGAMCAKKRCNSATSIELPVNQNNESRQGHKRCYDQSGNDFQMQRKRMAMDAIGPPRMLGMPPPVVPSGQCPPPGASLYGAPIPQQQQQVRFLSTHMQPQGHQLLVAHPSALSMSPSTSGGLALAAPIIAENSVMHHLTPTYINHPQYFISTPPPFTQQYHDDSTTVTATPDPFVPPSYAPEMKNAVVLQPL